MLSQSSPPFPIPSTRSVSPTHKPIPLHSLLARSVRPVPSRGPSASPSLTSSPPSPLFSDSPCPVPSSVTNPTSPSRPSSTCIPSPLPSPNSSKRLRLDSSARLLPVSLSSRNSSPISSPDSCSAIFPAKPQRLPSPCDLRSLYPVRMPKPLLPSELTTNQQIHSPSLHPTNPPAIQPNAYPAPPHRTHACHRPYPAGGNENDVQSIRSFSRPLSLHPSLPLSHSHRHASSKTRPRKPPSPPLRLAIQPGYCLVFGRQPDLSAIPIELHPKDMTMVPIKLPGTFTHASRIHCICTVVAPPLGGLNMHILVKGQNGLSVEGQRMHQGSSSGIEIERIEGEKIKLDFHGGKMVECYVKFDDSLSPPSLSPPLVQHHPPSQAADQGDHCSVSTHARKRKGRSSDPTPITRGLQYPPTPVQESFASPPLDTSVPPSKRQCLSRPPDGEAPDKPILNLSVDERLDALIPTLGLDLVGLIASAIVFAPRATVSTTEVIRGVLEAQPSLREAVLSVLPPPPARASPRPTSVQEKATRGRSSSVVPPHLVVKHETPEPTSLALKSTGSQSQANSADKGAIEDETNDEKTERVINACRPIMLEVLQANWSIDGSGMFGCVSNEGLKDAAGQPLEALWYYQPQRDPDLERRANLQPCVRHVRHTQTTSKQYYFQRTRESTRRRS